MSTKKRTFIILMVYPIFLLLLFCFLVLTSNTTLSNILDGISLTYSIIFSVFMILMGIFTRIMSCKPVPCILSIIFGSLSVCVSLSFFNVAYSNDKIFEITNGLDRKLSMFRDIGPDYIAYCTGLFLIGYILTAAAIKIIHLICSRKLYKKLSERDLKQTEANNPMFLKSYNKTTNRYERYLVYIDSKGRIKTSEKVRYFDMVDLVVIDSNRKIYVMIEKPRKITMKEYILMMQ